MITGESGWIELKCAFFVKTCRAELGDYLHQQGFSEEHVTEAGGIVYARGNTFLEFGYEVDTAPHYAPTVVIGFGRSKNDEQGRVCAVPFWALISDDVSERRYSFWRFATPAELADVLSRIKTRILEIYGRPLWLDSQRLQLAITGFQRRLR